MKKNAEHFLVNASHKRDQQDIKPALN